MTQSDAESVSLGMILCMRGKYMTFSWLTVTQELIGAIGKSMIVGIKANSHR